MAVSGIPLALRCRSISTTPAASGGPPVTGSNRRCDSMTSGPTSSAINQNWKSTKNIGIVVPHIVDPFFAEIVRLIEERCIEAGYGAIVLSSHGEADLEGNALDLLWSMKLAGAIIAPLGEKSDRDRIMQFASEVPTVLFDSPLGTGEAFVGTDNFHSVGLIVDYLCRTGEPPCFLEMPAVNENASDRRQAYIGAMECGRA